jgi:ethanolamine ammonia-lyase small subunit
MKSLREFTNARVDLGRVGDSVPTATLLEFRLAHARARDAVHLPMDGRSLMHEFAALGWESIALQSQARTREEYLLRPDLGRSLATASRNQLAALALQMPVVYCVADGLSAAAVHRHAANLLKELRPAPPVVLIEQGRVAIGDDVGAVVQAEVCVLLIGERPGLSSPDSLGAYITYGPKPGRSDAERNCVSNIHDQGLSYELAAQKIHYLVHEARKRKLTGVELKERAGLLGSDHV